MTAAIDQYRAQVREVCRQQRAAFADLRRALLECNAWAADFDPARDADRLARAVIDANRALARPEVLLRQQERLAGQDECPRCHGAGRITEVEDDVRRRVRCPGCGGSGRLDAPGPSGPAPAGPRGHWQRLILTRQLARGGASWAVPLRWLWEGRSPSAAQRAALCRALAALECRGLLRRLGPPAPHRGARIPRATQARLTAAGAVWAEALTNQPNR